jgi:hypothetical protein
MVVGLGGFTKGAVEFAEQKGIRLLSLKDVLELAVRVRYDSE